MAAAEALTAAGRLDRAERLAADLLARPLPPGPRRGCGAPGPWYCARSRSCRSRPPGRAGPGPGGAQRRAGPGRGRALQALAGLRDERAGPLADIVLAAPGQHDGSCLAAARLTRALISWDGGQITTGLELLREAVRHCSGISPDARQVQPLLVLAAVLADVVDLAGADRLLEAADHPALPGVPARAALAIVRARIHLARGHLAEAGAAGQAALAVAQDLSADGYAATAHSVLSVIELRRGDIAAAARHLACRAPIGPQFADFYARPETLVAEAQVTEARDGPAAARGHLRGSGRPAGPARAPARRSRPGRLAGAQRAGCGRRRAGGRAARAAQALAVAHDPGFPALDAARPTAGAGSPRPGRPGRGGQAIPRSVARASATEASASCTPPRRPGSGDPAPREASAVTAGRCPADQARVLRRLRKLGIRRRHWSTPAARPVARAGTA